MSNPNLPPFRPMKLFSRDISTEHQQAFFLEVSDEFYLVNLIDHTRLVFSNNGQIDFCYRLADRLVQRWRVAGLTVYGNGKWYLTDKGRARRHEIIYNV